MNNITRLNTLERKISIKSKQEEPVWICICGNGSCICTNEHRYHNLSADCYKCKSSETWRFMKGKKCVGTPIMSHEEYPKLLELIKKGEVCLPLPIMGAIRVL